MDRNFAITQKRQKNRFKKHEDSLCEPYNCIEKTNIRKIGVPDAEEKKKLVESLL